MNFENEDNRINFSMSEHTERNPMYMDDYQQLAGLTESPVGSETFFRYTSSIGQLNERLHAVFNTMGKADIDQLKRFIYYDKPGEKVTKEVEPELRLTHGVLGLFSELYELSQIYTESDVIDRTHLLEELGDILWYIALIGSAYNLKLGDIAARNIAKLQQRYPDKFEVVNAIERDLIAERKALARSNSEAIVEDRGSFTTIDEYPH